MIFVFNAFWMKFTIHLYTRCLRTRDQPLNKIARSRGYNVWRHMFAYINDHAIRRVYSWHCRQCQCTIVRKLELEEKRKSSRSVRAAYTVMLKSRLHDLRSGHACNWKIHGCTAFRAEMTRRRCSSRQKTFITISRAWSLARIPLPGEIRK